jgi:hypothetical protein
MGCSTLMGPFRESETDFKLSPYLRDHVYSMNRKELAKFVYRELEQNHRWHLQHDPIYQINEVTSVTSQAELKGDLTDEPVEICGTREIYILSKVGNREDLSRVTILNQGDRARLFHRELKLYELIDPVHAKSLVEKITAENPGIRLDPWEG